MTPTKTPDRTGLQSVMEQHSAQTHTTEKREVEGGLLCGTNVLIARNLMNNTNLDWNTNLYQKGKAWFLDQQILIWVSGLDFNCETFMDTYRTLIFTNSKDQLTNILKNRKETSKKGICGYQQNVPGFRRSETNSYIYIFWKKKKNSIWNPQERFKYT